MHYNSNKKTASPLNSAKLRTLALHYVRKYATSKKKLHQYLDRKIKERGWDDKNQPDIDNLVEEFESRSYVDDAIFAASKARSLLNRGYGLKKLKQDIYANAIEAENQSEALAILRDNQWQAADNFARKKHIGPYAKKTMSHEQKRKQLGAFLRAGHDIKIAQKFIQADIEDIIDWDDIAD